MDFKIPPAWRQRARLVSEVLQRADDAVNTLANAKLAGSPISMALAGASIIGQILDAVAGNRDAADELRALGYDLVPTRIGEMFCSILYDSALVREEILLGDDREHTRIVIWKDVGIAAVYESSKHALGPFVMKGRALVDALVPLVWQTADLEITLRRIENGVSYQLTPLASPGAYFGSPSVEWLTDRLARRGQGARTLLLVGPTGCGKSTLGRLVGRALHADGHTLKVSAGALRALAHSDLLDLVTHLRPTVLLLDDVQDLFNAREEEYGPGAGSTGSEILSLMEALHGSNALVIGTLMDDQADGNGVKYRSGMRPGRIDEYIEIGPPDIGTRRAILRHYLQAIPEADVSEIDRLAKETKGLTGAYLAELAFRLRTYGIQTWKAEIDILRKQAPAQPQKGKMRKRQSHQFTALTLKLVERIAQTGQPLNRQEVIDAFLEEDLNVRRGTVDKMMEKLATFPLAQALARGATEDTNGKDGKGNERVTVEK